MRLPNQSAGVMYPRFTTPIRATGSGAVVAGGFFEDFQSIWKAKEDNTRWLEGKLGSNKTNVKGWVQEERVLNCLRQCHSAGEHHCDLKCCGPSGCNFA